MVQRSEPIPQLSERESYEAWLEYHRATLEMKCEGLSDAQLKEAAVPPSPMSLLGLVRHMAEVERGWFRRTLAGQEADRLWGPPKQDADWLGAVGDQACVDRAWSAWRGEVAFAEQWVEDHPDMGALVDHRGDQVSVRDVLVHMVEEYARHCGHADLLRECIDGRTGQ
jgi:uncharacterized damage-inducible protein DinB